MDVLGESTKKTDRMSSFGGGIQAKEITEDRQIINCTCEANIHKTQSLINKDYKKGIYLFIRTCVGLCWLNIGYRDE